MRIMLKSTIIGAIIGLVIDILLLPMLGINIYLLSSLFTPIYTLAKYVFFLGLLNSLGILAGPILMIPYIIIVGAIYGCIIGFIIEKIKK